MTTKPGRPLAEFSEVLRQAAKNTLYTFHQFFSLPARQRGTP